MENNQSKERRTVICRKKTEKGLSGQGGNKVEGGKQYIPGGVADGKNPEGKRISGAVDSVVAVFLKTRGNVTRLGNGDEDRI